MENKEFSKKLEARTKAFAIRIIKLSATLPNTVEGKIVRNQLTRQEPVLVQITVRQTEQEAEQILKIKLKSAKAKPAKQATGSKSVSI